MNNELNDVSIWSAIFNLQQAISCLSDELKADSSYALCDWGEVLQDKLQETISRCLGNGISEEAISNAIDAPMPPILAHFRHVLR